MPQSRQLAAIMFTDIVGYTALMVKAEDKAFRALTDFKKIAQPLVSVHSGSSLEDFTTKLRSWRDPELQGIFNQSIQMFFSPIIKSNLVWEK